MSNMSYCRFENTYKDLQDCYDNFDSEDLSDSERQYRRLIFKMCLNIREDYEGTPEFSEDDE